MEFSETTDFQLDHDQFPSRVSFDGSGLIGNYNASFSDKHSNSIPKYLVGFVQTCIFVVINQELARKNDIKQNSDNWIHIKASDFKV